MIATATRHALRRWMRSTAARFTLAGLICAAALVAVTSLWANHNPPEDFNRVPAALVNEDTPVTAQGVEVHAGAEAAQQVLDDASMQWHSATMTEAQAGLDSGRYFAILRIPSDYSANIASLDSSAPRQATMQFITSDAVNSTTAVAVVPRMEALTRSISSTLTLNFLNEIYGALIPAREQGQSAAQATDKLATDIATAATAAQQTGATATTAAAADKQAVASLQDVAGGLKSASDATAALATTTADAAASATTIAGASKAVDASLATIQQQLTTTGQTELAAAVGASRTNLTNSVTTPSTSLATSLQTASDSAKQVSSTLAVAAPKVEQAQAQAAQAAQASEQTAASAQQLATTLTGQLVPTAVDVKSALAAAAARVPPVSDSQRKQFTTVLAAPVTVEASVQHPAANFAASLAPLAGSVGLGLAGLLLFLLLRPWHARLRAAGHAPWLVVCATALPAAAIAGAGGLAATIGMGITALGVGAWPPLLIVSVLGAVCFAAIAQLLRAAWGGVGLYVGMGLLVLQAVASGAVFPAQSLAAPFRWLEPVLPMSYVADGIRRSVVGGPLGTVAMDIAVLIVWTGVALALSIWAVHYRRNRVHVVDRILGDGV